ncbi:MAG: hypothetical protein WC825_00310 [Gallionellaceae bacterium]
MKARFAVLSLLVLVSFEAQADLPGWAGPMQSVMLGVISVSEAMNAATYDPVVDFKKGDVYVGGSVARYKVDPLYDESSVAKVSGDFNGTGGGFMLAYGLSDRWMVSLLRTNFGFDGQGQGQSTGSCGSCVPWSVQLDHAGIEHIEAVGAYKFQWNSVSLPVYFGVTQEQYSIDAVTVQSGTTVRATADGTSRGLVAGIAASFPIGAYFDLAPYFRGTNFQGFQVNARIPGTNTQATGAFSDNGGYGIIGLKVGARVTKDFRASLDLGSYLRSLDSVNQIWMKGTKIQNSAALTLNYRF